MHVKLYMMWWYSHCLVVLQSFPTSYHILYFYTFLKAFHKLSHNLKFNTQHIYILLAASKEKILRIIFRHVKQWNCNVFAFLSMKIHHSFHSKISKSYKCNDIFFKIHFQQQNIKSATNGIKQTAIIIIFVKEPMTEWPVAGNGQSFTCAAGHLMMMMK